MKSGLKYLIILFLFIGVSSTKMYGYEHSTSSVDSRITTLSERTIADSAGYTIDLPIFLFQNMLAGDNNPFSSYLKVHTHLLCNIKELKRIQFYSAVFTKNTVVYRYIYPLKYYVYTLEKIII